MLNFRPRWNSKEAIMGSNNFTVAAPIFGQISFSEEGVSAGGSFKDSLLSLEDNKENNGTT